jgi:3-methyladenine DNA glycosylase/8-oxoguanine DNA glycosylase
MTPPGGPALIRHSSDHLLVELAYRPPLDWLGLVGFLGPRAIPGIEHAQPGFYQRTVVFGRRPEVIQVTSPPESASLQLSLPSSLANHLEAITRRVRNIFDLDADPGQISSSLSRDPRLKPLVKRRPGLRVPGCWDRFELMVRAILGQQVTVRGATTLATRLVQRHGRLLTHDTLDHELWLFPTPAKLASTDLSGLGMPGSRGRTIQGLAQAVNSGELDLEKICSLDELTHSLCTLPGIGPWTAHYVAMRAFNEPDAFPASDLAVLKALAVAGKNPTPRQATAEAEAWRPWRAYATMHLWMQESSPGKEA